MDGIIEQNILQNNKHILLYHLLFHDQNLHIFLILILYIHLLIDKFLQLHLLIVFLYDLMFFLAELIDFVERESSTAEETVETPVLDKFLKQGWWMETKPSIVLLITLKGSEKIEVELQTQTNDPTVNENEEETPDEPQQYDFFRVTVTKTGDLSLMFDCYANRGVLEVADISVLGPNKELKSRVRMDELENEGQELFFDYLEERSISDDFCKVVSDALYKFDTKEYKDWLADVTKFLSR